MSTFSKTEVVDARQFDGSVKNAKELVAWVHANGGTLVWQYAEDIRHDGVKVVKTITTNQLQLTLPRGSINNRSFEDMVFVAPTCWILIRQDGSVDWRTDEAMQTEFVQQ